MADLIKKERHELFSKNNSNETLEDINALINFANEVQKEITYLEQKKEIISGFSAFITGLICVFLVTYLKGDFENRETIVVCAISIFVSAIFTVRRIEEISVNIAAEARTNGELIDMINSLVEGLDFESERVVPTTLVKMKLRRLSFSVDSTRSLAHRLFVILRSTSHNNLGTFARKG